MTDWPKLSNQEAFRDFIRKFTEGFNSSDVPTSGDWLSDFIRIALAIVEQHPSFLMKNYSRLSLDREFKDAAMAAGDFPLYMGELASTLSPGWTAEEWKILFQTMLSAKYGGGYLYIKKNPAKKLMLAAKKMTPSQLMSEFGISRSYAYRLIVKK